MQYLGASLKLCVVAGLCLMVTSSGSRAETDPPAGQVRIADVDVRLSDHGPVVLLKAEGKFIPIFVDATVAGSIAAALTGQRTTRPLSHDLMHTILDALGAKVTQTVITLKDGVYYAALSVVTEGATKVFDSRSSDSIALAVHFKAPIFVPRELLESAGRALQEPKAETL